MVFRGGNGGVPLQTECQRLGPSEQHNCSYILVGGLRCSYSDMTSDE